MMSLTVNVLKFGTLNFMFFGLNLALYAIVS